jgi:hypothetical protein
MSCRSQGRDNFSAANDLSRSRKNISASRMVPSGKRIRYALPDMDDFEPHNRMKSSAVFTRSPAVLSLRRKWSADFPTSYSPPFRRNVTPCKASTDPIRYRILAASPESWAYAYPPMRDRITRSHRGYFFIACFRYGKCPDRPSRVVIWGNRYRVNGFIMLDFIVLMPYETA